MASNVCARCTRLNDNDENDGDDHDDDENDDGVTGDREKIKNHPGIFSLFVIDLRIAQENPKEVDSYVLFFSWLFTSFPFILDVSILFF